MKTKQLEPFFAWEISEAIQKARDMAATEDVETRFEFNDVDMRVRFNSSETLLLRDFHRALSGKHDGPVGPHPAPELSPETIARDAEIEAEHERRLAERHAEYERERQAKVMAYDAETLGGTFSLADPEEWRRFAEANADPYGSGVVRYAERWARLMEARMAKGNELEAVAEKASFDADTEGITGFMYGCAVSTLAQTWKYGDRLRRWHNLETQLGDEGVKANESGGTLNPALLNIG